MAELLTSFARSPEFESAFAPCTESYRSGDREWPANVLSSRTVVYADGTVARAGDPVVHRVDPDELELCRRLSGQAGAIVGDVPVALPGEGLDHWSPYFRAADADAGPPPRIDEDWLRDRFGGTICPIDSVWVQPLRTEQDWLPFVEGFPEHEEPMRALVAFLGSGPLRDPHFVEIGSVEWDEDGPPDELPEGFETLGCVLPRLVFGLTEQGSVVGLFGRVVLT